MFYSLKLRWEMVKEFFSDVGTEINSPVKEMRHFH